MTKLSRNFYTRNTFQISREILGKILVHNSQKGITSGRIVEVEAYVGPNDPASHTYLNRRTQRTEIQFREGGFIYVYQVYGIHFCFNVVTEAENKPEVILVRALEPIEGIKLMIKRRGFKEVNQRNIFNLANGPAKLCEAMEINKTHYGADLCGNKIYIVDDNFHIKPEDIIASPRINIDYSGKAAEYPWRFFIKGNPFVSKAKQKK